MPSVDEGDVQKGAPPVAADTSDDATQTSSQKNPDGETIPEPEGIDVAASDGWGDYPLDAVFVRTESRTVSEVVKRIEAARYVLDPDFQRDFVWSNSKSSKLIESCIMRIPLPVFYVAEAPDGRIIVVDGLQRLTSFVRFIDNKFRLTGLASGEGGASSHELEGKYFEDLPLNLQERVLDTQLTMYILDAKAPERARLDIFERVNSGQPLTRQQMRNALYNGHATKWLRSAAGGEAFQAATGGTLNPKTMRDREAINRFCAFKLLGWKNYLSGDMDNFLADSLTALNNLSEDDRIILRSQFDKSMRLNMHLFGEHAFRKSILYEGPNPSRSVINISFFEVCAVGLSSVEGSSEDFLNQIREQIVEILRTQEFDRAITYSTNSTVQVRRRFAEMEAALAKAGV